jgi:methionyl-tRNA formyltransferase
MLNALYCGSPDFSADTLDFLAASQRDEAGRERFRIVGALTNAPSPKGRHRTPEPTPIGVRALRAGIPVLAPEKLDAECRSAIAALKPDILVCFAFGKTFGPKFLALFPLGGINLHPSLLPKYRGAIPVPAAILNRERETGVSIPRILLEPDSGGVFRRRVMPLDGTETAENLLNRAATLGAELLRDVLYYAAEHGKLPPETPQDDAEATYCTRLTKADGRIDWSQNAEEIDARIRAFYPRPGAFTYTGGELLKIHRAAVFAREGADAPPGTVCGTDKAAGILVQAGRGIIALQTLQRATKRAVGWRDFINGYPQFVGTALERSPHEASRAV